MDDLLNEVLHNYSIENPKIKFIRHNENRTYRLKNPASLQEYVLRIHKSSSNFSRDIFTESGSSLEFLKGEMEALNVIRRNTDLPVQIPIKNKKGEFVTVLRNGTLATVLTWIDGSTVEENEQTEDLAFKAGRMAGKLHSISKYRIKESNIKRYSYDKKLLLDSIVKLKSAFYRRDISEGQFAAIADAINEILTRIDELGSKDKHLGLVHSDLAKSNMIVSGDEIIPIDFSLCGYSYYYMDLGSLFSHFTDANLRGSIVAGYRSITGETIDLRYIEAFMVFQVILYLDTHIKSAAKNAWFSEALNRWSRELFIPLSKGIPFIKIS